MKKKGKKKWIILGVVTVIAVAVAVVSPGNPQAMAAYTQEIVTTGSITSYYSFTGNVKVENSQSITAAASMTVREVYVQEGDHVYKGDRLLRTSDGEVHKATVSGEVDRLHVMKDDEVKAGDALIDIVDYDHMVIEIRVDEFDVPAVEAGKAALVTVNALGATFDTTVIRLDRQATQSGDISYYLATLGLGDVPGVLPGMQVDVRITNAHAENVTTLSMDALQFTATNQPFVQVKGENGTQIVPVRVGVNDGVRVEILDGLRSGDAVQVPPKANPSMAFGFGDRVGGMGGRGSE